MLRSVPSRSLALAAALTLLAACGDSAPVGPEGGVAGNWTVTAMEDATGCGEGTSTTTLTVRIEQTGNSLTVTIDGVDYTGTLTGTQATWSGSYPDDGGTTTEQFTVTFTNGNTQMSGGSTWTWTDGGSSCSGTVQVTGTI